MITRQQYLNDGGSNFDRADLHRKYYGQFVNDEVKRLVLRYFPLETLQQSFAKDKHFNTKLTPLERWDSMGGFAFSRTTGEMLRRPTSTEPIEHRLLKEAGEGFSSSTAVCVYKEAARQILEGVKS